MNRNMNGESTDLAAQNEPDVNPPHPPLPLPKGRVYHFNVVYNHAKSKLSHTADTELALGWTQHAVEELQLLGVVNTYYYDRDFTQGQSLFVELSRVLGGSELTVILLTPGFVRDCWPRYCQFSCFKQLCSAASILSLPSSGSRSTVLTSKEPALHALLVAVGLGADGLPNDVNANKVLFFNQDWRKDEEAWQCLKTAMLSVLAPEQVGGVVKRLLRQTEKDDPVPLPKELDPLVDAGCSPSLKKSNIANRDRNGDDLGRRSLETSVQGSRSPTTHRDDVVHSQTGTIPVFDSERNHRTGTISVLDSERNRIDRHHTEHKGSLSPRPLDTDRVTGTQVSNSEINFVKEESFVQSERNHADNKTFDSLYSYSRTPVKGILQNDVPLGTIRGGNLQKNDVDLDTNTDATWQKIDIASDTTLGSQKNSIALDTTNKDNNLQKTNVVLDTTSGDSLQIVALDTTPGDSLQIVALDTTSGDILQKNDRTLDAASDENFQKNMILNIAISDSLQKNYVALETSLGDSLQTNDVVFDITPGDSLQKSDVALETTPCDSLQESVVAFDTFPGDSLHGNGVTLATVPGDTLHGNGVTLATVPGDTLHGNGVTLATVPGDTLHGNGVTLATVPGDTLHGNITKNAYPLTNTIGKIDNIANNENVYLPEFSDSPSHTCKSPLLFTEEPHVFGNDPRLNAHETLITKYGAIQDADCERIANGTTLQDKDIAFLDTCSLVREKGSGRGTDDISSQDNTSENNFTLNKYQNSSTQDISSQDNTFEDNFTLNKYQNSSTQDNTSENNFTLNKYQNSSTQDNTSENNFTLNKYQNSSTQDNTFEDNFTLNDYQNSSTQDNREEDINSRDSSTQDVSSQNSTQDISSENNTQNSSTEDISSENNTLDISSQNNTLDISSENNTLDISSQNNTHDISSQKSTQDISCENNTQDITSGNNTQDISSENNTKNSSTEDISSENNTLDISSENNTKNSSTEDKRVLENDTKPQDRHMEVRNAKLANSGTSTEMDTTSKSEAVVEITLATNDASLGDIEIMIDNNEKSTAKRDDFLPGQLRLDKAIVPDNKSIVTEKDDNDSLVLDILEKPKIAKESKMLDSEVALEDMNTTKEATVSVIEVALEDMNTTESVNEVVLEDTSTTEEATSVNEVVLEDTNTTEEATTSVNEVVLEDTNTTEEATASVNEVVLEDMKSAEETETLQSDVLLEDTKNKEEIETLSSDVLLEDTKNKEEIETLNSDVLLDDTNAVEKTEMLHSDVSLEDTKAIEESEIADIDVGLKDRNMTIEGLENRNTTIEGLEDRNTIEGLEDRNTTIEGLEDRNTTIEGLEDRNTTIEGLEDRNMTIEGLEDRNTTIEGLEDRNTTVQEKKTASHGECADEGENTTMYRFQFSLGGKDVTLNKKNCNLSDSASDEESDSSTTTDDSTSESSNYHACLLSEDNLPSQEMPVTPLKLRNIRSDTDAIITLQSSVEDTLRNRDKLFYEVAEIPAIPPPSSQSTSGEKTIPPPSSQSTSGEKTIPPPSSQSTSGEKTIPPPSSQSTSGEKTIPPPSSQSTSGEKTIPPPSSQFTSGEKTIPPPSSHSTSGEKTIPPPSSQSTSGEKTILPPSSQSTSDEKTIPPPSSQSTSDEKTSIEAASVEETISLSYGKATSGKETISFSSNKDTSGAKIVSLDSAAGAGYHISSERMTSAAFDETSSFEDAICLNPKESAFDKTMNDEDRDKHSMCYISSLEDVDQNFEQISKSARDDMKDHVDSGYHTESLPLLGDEIPHPQTEQEKNVGSNDSTGGTQDISLEAEYTFDDVDNQLTTENGMSAERTTVDNQLTTENSMSAERTTVDNQLTTENGMSAERTTVDNQLTTENGMTAERRTVIDTRAPDNSQIDLENEMSNTHSTPLQKPLKEDNMQLNCSPNSISGHSKHLDETGTDVATPVQEVNVSTNSNDGHLQIGAHAATPGKENNITWQDMDVSRPLGPADLLVFYRIMCYILSQPEMPFFN